MGSGVLHDRDTTQALVGFIGRHAKAQSEVWIADPNRGNRTAFGRRMHGLGDSFSDEHISSATTSIGQAYRGRLLVQLRT